MLAVVPVHLPSPIPCQQHGSGQLALSPPPSRVSRERFESRRRTYLLQRQHEGVVVAPGLYAVLIVVQHLWPLVHDTVHLEQPAHRPNRLSLSRERHCGEAVDAVGVSRSVMTNGPHVSQQGGSGHAAVAHGWRYDPKGWDPWELHGARLIAAPPLRASPHHLRGSWRRT